MTRRSPHVLLSALGLLALLATGPAGAAPAPGADGDGLVRNERGTWVLPGARFDGYDAVLLAPVEVAFRRHWLEDLNGRRGVPRYTVAEMDALGRELGALLERALRRELQSAGWRLVERAGDDVLRVQPALRDLDVVAPDPDSQPGRRVYVMRAGEARLAVEVFDGPTRQLLARAAERRDTGELGELRWASRALNRMEFERAFEAWARGFVRELNTLRGWPPRRPGG